MILTLEVIGAQAERLGTDRRRVFDRIGGTIGRLPDNSWVFADPYVSGRHALIRYVNGRYYIEDTSTNGVFINAPDSRLSKTQAHPLKHGDVIFIDTYQIMVTIERDAQMEESARDPLAVLSRLDRGPARDRNRPAAPGLPPRADRFSAEEDRTVSMSSSDPGERDVEADNATEWFGLGEMSGPVVPNRQAPARGGSLPPPVTRPAVSGWGAKLSPGPGPSGPAKPHKDADGEASIRMAMEAAGVQGLEPSDETARVFGEILRAAVAGVMEVLRSREQLKDEMQIRGTTFKPADNNPLKFSADVDDAFHNLLVKRSSAYLSPPDAFADALNDILEHQLAVHSAMRFAFETMLAQFDPNRMQDEFDHQARKGSILGVPAKLRYWDMYRDKYSDIVKDAEAGFHTLFANEFAKAYEDQIRRLKARGRTR